MGVDLHLATPVLASGPVSLSCGSVTSGGTIQVQDILSTIISDWNTAGDKVVTVTAKQCTKQQIFDETWAQLKAHLVLAGNGKIEDGDRVESFLDPAITFDGPDPKTALVKDNLEPLLVNTKNSRVNRPSAATLIPNFVVASDYVLTETDLACMEPPTRRRAMP